MARRIIRGLILVFALGQLAPLGIHPAAAQSADGTYRSPTYGYSLTWEDPWFVQDEESVDAFDILTLDNGVSMFSVAGGPGDGDDVEGCLTEIEDTYLATDGVTDLDFHETDDGETIVGEDDLGAYALYELSSVDDAGVESEFAVFADCRAIGEDARLISIHLMPLETLDAQFPLGQDLLNQIDLPDGANDRADLLVDEEADGDLSEEEFTDLVDALVEDIDAYWDRMLDEDGIEQPDADHVIYDRRTKSGCDRRGEWSRPGDGSFYCPFDETIYLDLEAELAESAVYGAGSIVFAVAHEWGHHVEWVLDLYTDDRLTIQNELTADCFAGAYIADAVNRGRIPEDVAERQIPKDVRYLGDPPGIPDDDPSAHGTPRERVAAYRLGYADGPADCVDAYDLI